MRFGMQTGGQTKVRVKAHEAHVFSLYPKIVRPDKASLSSPSFPFSVPQSAVDGRRVAEPVLL